MKKRVRDPEGKRVSLLEAGLHLADQFGLANMSVNDVAAGAGVGKGSFYVHFPDRAAFVLELHRGFHDNLVAEIRESCAGMTPGLERLTTAATTYLDTCLRDRDVRALLLDIRSELNVADEVAARVAQITRLFEQDLRAALGGGGRASGGGARPAAEPPGAEFRAIGGTTPRGGAGHRSR